MREVLAGRLWTGNAHDARDIQRVLDLGVVAVVDVAIEERPAQYPRDVAYFRIPLLDGPDNQPGMLALSVEIVVRLVNAGLPTLVACSGGMSRSPTIAAAALSRLEEIDLEDSILRIAALGPCDVSPGLWSQLITISRRDE